MNSTSEFEESDSRPALIGLVLDGRYRVDSVLGRGGFATVYLATDERSFGRPVVVKVPHTEVLAQKGFRKRFDQEILSLTRLEHPHIVKVLDVGTVNGIPYVVLQYLAGGSLTDRIQLKGGRLLLPDVTSWLRAIAGALDFIHRNGFIHRDVKPSNILFDAEGHPFLADFGIVKAVESSEMALTLTETGKMLGSVRYMAPEAVHPDKISPGSYDQYSLGVVVYYALSAAFPHAGETPLQLLYNRVAEPPEPLASLAPDVPPGVAAVVMRALRAEPVERFASCTEFARALEQEFLEPKPEAVQAAADVPEHQTQPDETTLAHAEEAGDGAQSFDAVEAAGAEDTVSESIELQRDESTGEMDLEAALPRWLVRSLWVLALSVPVLGAGLLGLHLSGTMEDGGQQKEKDGTEFQARPTVTIPPDGDELVLGDRAATPGPATASPMPSPAVTSEQEPTAALQATESPVLAPLAGASPTETSTEQPSATSIATQAEASVPTATVTETATSTQTEVPPIATVTETASATGTEVPPIATVTETASATETEVPPTARVTETTVPSETPVPTATETPTARETHTPSASPTETPRPSATKPRPTRSPTRTAKPRPSPTTTTPPEPLVEGKPLRQWIAEAGDPDLAVRRRAIQTLGRLGPRAGAAVPAIVGAIRDPDPEVRLDAVIALVQIDAQAKRSVPELVNALKDPAPGVRSAAAFALAKLAPGDPSVIPALTEALGDSRVQIRQLAAMHLGSFGKAASAAAPRLVERLSDPQEPVRMAAVQALIDMGLLVEARIVKRVDPKIPAAARKARVRGSVVLRGVVRADGSVGKVTVVQGLSNECNEAAEKALSKWKFEPSTYQGRPVESFITVTMPFDATQPADD